MGVEIERMLPFKVGDVTESKCFIAGYRGAWFRSKIKKIKVIKGSTSYLLEFFDYPGEKDRWTSVYQKIPRGDGKRELMVRPSFPAFYKESHLPDSFPTCDVVAVIRDGWKVGDLVDWWFTDCYWSGTVTNVLGDNKFEVHLLEPPIGEGKYYEAEYKDLRPRLDWSPKNGWTVPMPEDYGDFGSCVRLLHPNNQVSGGGPCLEVVGDGFSCETENNLSSPLSSAEVVKVASVMQEKVFGDLLGVGSKIPSSEYVPSSLNYLEEIWIGQRNYWSTLRCPCTIESSIIELEELSLKIDWLKDVLKLGLEWPNATKPCWRFLVTDTSLEQ